MYAALPEARRGGTSLSVTFGVRRAVMGRAEPKVGVVDMLDDGRDSDDSAGGHLEPDGGDPLAAMPSRPRTRARPPALTPQDREVKDISFSRPRSLNLAVVGPCDGAERFRALLD